MGLFTAILNTVGLAAEALAAYIIIWKVLFRKPIEEWKEALQEANPSLPKMQRLQQDNDGWDVGADLAIPKFDERRKERWRAWWSMGLVLFGLLCSGVATWIGYAGSLVSGH